MIQKETKRTKKLVILMKTKEQLTNNELRYQTRNNLFEIPNKSLTENILIHFLYKILSKTIALF